jgi:hypothetical protein
MRLRVVEMRGSSDLEKALRAASDARVEALYVVSSRHTVLNIRRIVEFATTNRLPLVGERAAGAQARGPLTKCQVRGGGEGGKGGHTATQSMVLQRIQLSLTT